MPSDGTRSRRCSGPCRDRAFLRKLRDAEGAIDKGYGDEELEAVIGGLARLRPDAAQIMLLIAHEAVVRHADLDAADVVDLCTDALVNFEGGSDGGLAGCKA